MKRDGLGRFLRAFEIGLQLLAFRSQPDEVVANVVFLQKPCLVGLVSAVELATHGSKPALDAGAIGGQAGRKAFALIVVGFNIGGDQIGLRQIGLEAVEDGVFDRVEIVDAPMIAGARFLHLGALDTRLPLARILDRHAGAAAPAFKQPRQDALRLADMVRLWTAAFLLDRNGPVVNVLFEDGQGRRLDRLPFALRIGTRDTLARVGSLIIRTLFQTILPAYNSFRISPLWRVSEPLMVDAVQKRPRGGGTRREFSVAAISRGVRPST